MLVQSDLKQCGLFFNRSPGGRVQLNESVNLYFFVENTLIICFVDSTILSLGSLLLSAPDDSDWETFFLDLAIKITID